VSILKRELSNFCAAETEFHPPKFLVEQARLRDYAVEYRRSVDDAEGFWTGSRTNWSGSHPGRRSLHGRTRPSNGLSAASATSPTTAWTGR